MLCYIHKSVNLLLVVFSVIVILPVSSHDSEVFESYDTTEIKIVKLKQTWTIKNFRFCDLKTGEQLKSPTFSTGNNDTCKWRLDLYPKGLKEEHKDYVSLYVIPLSCNATAQYRLSILNAKQDEIRVLNDTHIILSWVPVGDMGNILTTLFYLTKRMRFSYMIS